MTATEPAYRSLPDAACVLGLSLDRLRHLLRKRPDVRDALPRSGGKLVIDERGLAMLRDLIAANK